MHEGGFGVEPGADKTIRFTWPDGRVIEEHPQLPATGSADGLRDSISSEGEPPIDATDWIIPVDVMDLDLVLGGLMQRVDKRSSRTEKSSSGR